MNYGFIGTGGITTAMVTGLCSADSPPETIWVSPRNRQKANRLAADYAAVTVGSSNQAVVDQSDVVVLAILPQHKESVLAPLSFRRDQAVIHLLAGTSIDAVRPLVAPATDIVRAVPPSGLQSPDRCDCAHQDGLAGSHDAPLSRHHGQHATA